MASAASQPTRSRRERGAGTPPTTQRACLQLLLLVTRTGPVTGSAEARRQCRRECDVLPEDRDARCSTVSRALCSNSDYSDKSLFSTSKPSRSSSSDSLVRDVVTPRVRFVCPQTALARGAPSHRARDPCSSRNFQPGHATQPDCTRELSSLVKTATICTACT